MSGKSKTRTYFSACAVHSCDPFCCGNSVDIIVERVADILFFRFHNLLFENFNFQVFFISVNLASYM